MQLPAWSLTLDEQATRNTRTLASLFAAWLILTWWLEWHHVFWRDEIRAFSLALSGSTTAEMLHNIHGEGHPALWYLLLRGTHALFPCRAVLPILAALVGIAAMALLVFRSPFRPLFISLIMFSLFGAFEYVVVARNYGISMLVMFALAMLYPTTKRTLWFGLFIAILCNTNVPSCIFGAAFLLYRFVEMLTSKSHYNKRDWIVLLGNACIAAIGAIICFMTVYPTFNDGAVSSNFHQITQENVWNALFDNKKSYWNLGPPAWGILPILILTLSCLAFARIPAALCAAFTALIGTKLFFYFVYLSYYRHEALFVVFLVCLHWMSATSPATPPPQDSHGIRTLETMRFIGICAFVQLLAIQFFLLAGPIHDAFIGTPYSRSADVARLLQAPQLRGAVVMADPDTMLEPLPYYADNPLWFLREQRFGKVVKLTRNARQHLTLDDIIADAARLTRKFGRPVIFLEHDQIQNSDYVRPMLFDDTTAVSRESYHRFMDSTRLVAHLPPAATGEEYDVYLFRRFS